MFKEEYIVLVRSGATERFPKSQDMLISPFTMISSVKCLLLTLYLTSSRKPIGALLAQEIKEVEHPI